MIVYGYKLSMIMLDEIIGYLRGWLFVTKKGGMLKV